MSEIQEPMELTTIDVENMTPKEQEIYHRRMRVFANLFVPPAVRLTHEALAENEKVERDTITRDIRWIKITYPDLWSNEQIKHGFAYSMLKVSNMYEVMIRELYDSFQATTDIFERIAIAKALNDLMPTYTNSKAHGVILEKIKGTVK